MGNKPMKPCVAQLLTAAEEGDVAAATAALEALDNAGVPLRKVKTSSKSGRETATHVAAREGHAAVVKLLAQRGADVNKGCKAGRTPLHLAAYYGQAAACGALVDAGADLEVVNKNGVTPLQYAAQGGYAETVALLASRGADINSKNMERQTALYYASYYGHTATVEALLKAGADPNITTRSGQVALNVASNGAIKQLLRNGGKKQSNRDSAGHDEATAGTGTAAAAKAPAEPRGTVIADTADKL